MAECGAGNLTQLFGEKLQSLSKEDPSGADDHGASASELSPPLNPVFI